MSTAARISWAVTIVLGSVGLLFVPVFAVPLFPILGIALYLATRRNEILSIVAPPALLPLCALVHLIAPDPFLHNWNHFGPNPAPVPNYMLTPVELLSYTDSLAAGLALPVLILTTPALLCVAVWIAVRLEKRP